MSGSVVQAIRDVGKLTPGLTVSLLANLVIVIAFLWFLREERQNFQTIQQDASHAALQQAVAMSEMASAVDALQDELRAARR